eukprot:s597_g2.t1
MFIKETESKYAKRIVCRSCVTVRSTREFQNYCCATVRSAARAAMDVDPFLVAFEDIIAGLDATQNRQFSLLLELYRRGRIEAPKIEQFLEQVDAQNGRTRAAASMPQPVHQCGSQASAAPAAASRPQVVHQCGSQAPVYRPQQFGPGFGQAPSYQGKGHAAFAPHEEPFYAWPTAWPSPAEAQHEWQQKGFVSYKGNKGGKGQKGGKGGKWSKGGKGYKGPQQQRQKLPVPTNIQEALSAHQQFMRLNETFLFRPRPSVPLSLQPSWTLLAENGQNLYKNIRRHCQDGSDGDDTAARIIRKLCNTTYWAADKNNVIEQQRQQRRAPTEGTEVTSVFSAQGEDPD